MAAAASEHKHRRRAPDGIVLWNGTGLVHDARPCGADWLLRLHEEADGRQWRQRVPSFVREQLVRRDRRYLSQEHQDALIQRVFACVGMSNHYFVEFGFNEAGYGLDGGPFNRSSGAQTHMLHELGWRGLLLDGENENAAINLRKHFLFASNVQALFNQYAVPKDLDFLSVDMDSHDLFVLRSILSGGWRPRLFSAEFNCNYGSHRYPIALLDPTLERGEVPPGYVFKYADCSWGTSSYALQLLGREFGYSLIARVRSLDLFFLRDDLRQHKPVQNWTAIFTAQRPADASQLARFEGGVCASGKKKSNHPAIHNPALLDRLIDYSVYRKTMSVPLAVASAKETMRTHLGHAACWRPLFRRPLL